MASWRGWPSAVVPQGPPVACWQQQFDTNLGSGGWPPSKERCAYRYSTLAAAQLSCTRTVGCAGVTRDSGLDCPTSSAFGLPTMRFPYELRDGGSKKWRKMTSWRMTLVNGSCQHSTVAAFRHSGVVSASTAGTCAIRTTAEVLRANGSATTAVRSDVLATVLIETAGSCSADDEPGSRPTPAGRDDRQRPASCASRVSLAEALDAQPASPSSACGTVSRSGEDRCFVWHGDGLNDGWGAQHFRRVLQHGQSGRLGGAIAGHHGLVRLHLKAWGCPPHT